jgi:hypothetical protein
MTKILLVKFKKKKNENLKRKLHKIQGWPNLKIKEKNKKKKDTMR